ncbi:MAG: hypothetical protein RLZZ66_1705 [Pseudomonadota bacterium]|jgi:UPF0716 protein FxsA
MKIFRVLFIAIIVMSFLELYVLIAVGSILGAFITILLIIASAGLGSYLLKEQGLATWQRFQETLARQEVPAYELMEGFLILVGGALLLTPGFITDTVGLICLLPSLRKTMISYIMKYYFIPPNNANENVLEGEFRKEDN